MKIPLDVNGYHIANYIIDFVILHTNDTKEYVEIKGFETDTWRMKWRLFEAIYAKEFAEKNWTMTLVK